MTITLPEEKQRWLEERARLNGCASVSEYLLRLVEEEEEAGLYDLPGPSELTPQDREQLEAMLDAGMNSGPPMAVTPEFWEERKRVLEERMAKRRAAYS